MGLIASRQMVESEVDSRAAVLFQGPGSCCISAGVLHCVVDSRVAVLFRGPESCCTSAGVHRCVGESVVIVLESPGSSLLWVVSPGKGGILWTPGQDALLWADARKCPWNWMQKIGLGPISPGFFIFVRWDLGRNALPWIYKEHRRSLFCSFSGILSVCRCYQEKVEFKGQDFDLLPGQQRRTWNSCRNRRFSFRRVGKWDFVCMPLLPEKSRFQGSRN
ncbi:uncharacterized protein LOC26536055 isoform X3 [Drosophila yakuba]|uniref:uncharacterized protein LOC26536055 isoform X3 n=1 Tax=Drosophila yakuba TaxID=7245 RepID=UPI0019308457|nr:uncharacterized protein LOC26536055 isoform X3 [Drosophila yakuba]